MEGQKSIVHANYAREFLHRNSVTYIDLRCTGATRVLSMKSQRCDAILKRAMRYVIFFRFSSISECKFSPVQGKYRNWAKGANFLSKLPGDIKKRKAAAEEVTRTLDHDLREKKLSERVIPYSDKLFRRAAIEWLVATDQVRNSFFQLIL